MYPNYEMNRALNKDRLDRYRAEADMYRLVAIARRGQSKDRIQNDWSPKVHARRAFLAAALRRMAEAISPSEQQAKVVTTE